jgi:signal transduction histidine kinase
VFERFYRGANSAHTHGSGLGLSVTAAIVEAHGGSAGIVQEDDTTVLRIVLPNSSAD